MGELSELETKTHLHVYINNQVGEAPITNPFSLPFHQDNGLFLMLTPSDKLPVVLKDFQGSPVFTDRLGSDAVMFRMKIAEYNAVPAVNGGLNFMESLELHES